MAWEGMDAQSCFGFFWFTSALELGGDVADRNYTLGQNLGSNIHSTAVHVQHGLMCLQILRHVVFVKKVCGL